MTLPMVTCSSLRVLLNALLESSRKAGPARLRLSAEEGGLTALRRLGGWVFAGNLIEWIGAGSGRRGAPPAAFPPLRERDDDEHSRRTERKREIELRILMSNWM